MSVLSVIVKCFLSLPVDYQDSKIITFLLGHVTDTLKVLGSVSDAQQLNSATKSFSASLLQHTAVASPPTLPLFKLSC